MVYWGIDVDAKIHCWKQGVWLCHHHNFHLYAGKITWFWKNLNFLVQLLFWMLVGHVLTVRWVQRASSKKLHRLVQLALKNAVGLWWFCRSPSLCRLVGRRHGRDEHTWYWQCVRYFARGHHEIAWAMLGWDQSVESNLHVETLLCPNFSGYMGNCKGSQAWWRTGSCARWIGIPW